MMLERLRTFTPQGLRQLETLLRDAYVCGTRSEEVADNVERLTFAESYTQIFPTRVMIDTERVFATRFEMAQYLSEQLRAANVKVTELRYDKGLWTWLAAVYFRQGVIEGHKLPYVERFIYDPGYRRFERHLIAGPLFFYWDHRGNEDVIKPFLDTPLHRRGTHFREVASQKWFLGNISLLTLVVRLYYDTTAKQWKPGSLSANEPGTLRRLIAVLSQLDLTYDLWGMQTEELLRLLPKEFARWKSPVGVV